MYKYSNANETLVQMYLQKSCVCAHFFKITGRKATYYKLGRIGDTYWEDGFQNYPLTKLSSWLLTEDFYTLFFLSESWGLVFLSKRGFVCLGLFKRRTVIIRAYDKVCWSEEDIVRSLYLVYCCKEVHVCLNAYNCLKLL